MDNKKIYRTMRIVAVVWLVLIAFFFVAFKILKQ